jgi:hypothetical protein
MNRSIFDEAVKAYHNYIPLQSNREEMDKMTSEQYELCGDIFTDGFQAGVAYVLAMGKGEVNG